MSDSTTAISNLLIGLAESARKNHEQLYRGSNPDFFQEVRNTLADDLLERLDYEPFHLLYFQEVLNIFEGMISVEVSPDTDVLFILLNVQFVESMIRSIIEQKEGMSCCADKTRYLMKNLLKFYITGETIEHDFTQQYTYQIPKEVFQTHDEIITFYKALRDLHHGRGSSYIKLMTEVYS